MVVFWTHSRKSDSFAPDDARRSTVATILHFNKMAGAPCHTARSTGACFEGTRHSESMATTKHRFESHIVSPVGGIN